MSNQQLEGNPVLEGPTKYIERNKLHVLTQPLL